MIIIIQADQCINNFNINCKILFSRISKYLLVNMDLTNINAQIHLEKLLKECETMEQQLHEALNLYLSKHEVKQQQKYSICLSRVLRFKFWIKQMLMKLNPDWEKSLLTNSNVDKIINEVTNLVSKVSIEGENDTSKGNFSNLISEVEFYQWFNKINAEKNKLNYEQCTRFREFRGNCDMRILDIKKGEEPNVNDICMVSSILTPDEFFIHIMNDNIEYLEIISDYLWDAYKHSKNIAGITKTELRDTYGEYFAYEGVTWMRVEVLNWFWDKGKRGIVLVQLVDYGGTFYTDIVNLRPLLLPVAFYPKLAYRCHFPYLFPHGIKSNTLQRWPKNTLQCIYELLENFDTIKYKVVHVNYCSKRNSYAVDIISTLEKNDRNTVGQILIDSLYAVPIIDKVAVPKLEYCTILREFKASFDIRDTVYALPYFEPFVRDPSLTGDILMRITHIDMPYFYVNVVEPESSESSLDIMTRTLNNPAMIDQYKRMVQVPVYFEIVMAQVDNKWHRAVIEDIKLREYYYDKITIQVFLVDSGETFNVPLHNIRVIPPEMLNQDFLAIRCKLLNAKLEFSRGSTFYAKIIDIQEHYYEVELQTTNDED